MRLIERLISWFRRLQIEWEDRFRYAPRIRNLLSQFVLLRMTWRTIPNDSQGIVRYVRDLATAARLATRTTLVNRALMQVHQVLPRLQSKEIDWTEFVPTAGDRCFHTATLLKPWISDREKGVLFLSFEREWVKLLHGIDTRSLSARYTVVLAPSSSPHNVVNYVVPALFPDPLFSLISHEDEPDVLPRISSSFRVVPLYASSWVLPALFRPRPWSDRDIDLIMIANFAKFKRHFALFQALRQLPRHLRILLVGQDQDGRTGATIQSLASDYGVAGRFELRQDLPYQQIPEVLTRARTSVILSRREGSCVVVAESLFANVPTALLADAEVGSRAFINPSTGVLLRPNDLAGQLLRFIETADQYQPRNWADAHISCFRSTQVLNDAIKRESLAMGQDWTRDLVPMYWCPNPRVVHDEDYRQLQPAYLDIQQRFGIGIGTDDEAALRLRHV